MRGVRNPGAHELASERTGWQNSERAERAWGFKSTVKSDSSRIFAGGFNALLDGVAAGVLARNGGILFALTAYS
jgi:hypothetical protein